MKRKHAVIRWTGDLGFDADVEDGSTLRLDASGSGAGDSPARLLLTSLAGCTAADTISILVKKRQPVSSYAVEVEGEQRDAHPRLYTAIRVTHRVGGEAIDDEAVARAIELSATKYCTVSATIATGRARISHHYVITDESGERSGDGAVIGPDGAGLEL